MKSYKHLICGTVKSESESPVCQGTVQDELKFHAMYKLKSYTHFDNYLICGTLKSKNIFFVRDNMGNGHIYHKDEILKLMFLRHKHPKVHTMSVSSTRPIPPCAPKKIRPEILSHIRREQLLGVVLNQLPATDFGKRTNN